MMMKWIKAKLGLEKRSSRIVHGFPLDMIPANCHISRQEAKERLRWYLFGCYPVEVTGVGYGEFANSLRVYLAKEDPELEKNVIGAAKAVVSGYVIHCEVTGPIRAL
jgi:hypothetical protein